MTEPTPRPDVPDELTALAVRASADRNHANLCACTAWPEWCTSDYSPTQWEHGDEGDTIAAVWPEIEKRVREQVAAEIYADQELGRVAAPYERCIRVALGRDPDGWPDDERDVNAIMATIGTVRCGLAGPHRRHTWSEQGHGRVCPGERIARGEAR